MVTGMVIPMWAGAGVNTGDGKPTEDRVHTTLSSLFMTILAKKIMPFL